MRAGLLRHRVEILSSVAATGETGEVTSTWQTAATVWASITPVAGREYLAADRVSSSHTCTIRLRWQAGLPITVRNRIRYGSRLFEVNAVANVGERNIYWELRCTEASE